MTEDTKKQDGQKANPRVGRGIKPRVKADESATEKPQEPEKEVSVIQGQSTHPEEAPEPSPEPQEQGNNLEPKKIALVGDVTVADAARLAAMLNESAERLSGAEPTPEPADPVAKPDSLTPEQAAKQADEAFGPISDPGAQPNGDYAVRLVIPEFYVESCRQWGEADGGKSIEQWANEFFVAQLEHYCTPAQTR